MKRILIPGSGGAPAINFTRSLRDAPEQFYLVGTDARFCTQRSEADKTFIGPMARDADHFDKMKDLIEREKIDFVHCQPDAEVEKFSEYRDKINAKIFMPDKKTVKICMNKLLSYQKWKDSGLIVPRNFLINNESDLKKALEEIAGPTWIRSVSGAAGRGSIPTENFELAKNWIDFNNDWGTCVASDRLTTDTVTWLSLWKDGELVVAQTRKRLYWELGSRAPSGVTGVTGTGVTMNDHKVDEIAQKAIFAIDNNPNGLFGVDMTYDKNGIPNPTEINIGRFFTTHYFFTKAGLNMPYIYLKAAFDEKIPEIPKKINPLPNNLYWIRGMDVEPILATQEDIDFDERNKL